MRHLLGSSGVLDRLASLPLVYVVKIVYDGVVRLGRLHTVTDKLPGFLCDNLSEHESKLFSLASIALIAIRRRGND